MPTIKSYSVGEGDMFSIRHDGDHFTIIDCHLSDDNYKDIIDDLKEARAGKGITRFICTHPDEDHFGGIHLLDDKIPIVNFYVVENQAIKDRETISFERYCQLRDNKDKAFYIEKGCTRYWMNLSDETRGSAGIEILWPDLSNEYFIRALEDCDAGRSYNNTSAVIRYQHADGASFLWLGDLETEFMKNIVDDIDLEKTTVVFASHHGRNSGRIPHSWLDRLQPQVIVIGEAPSRYIQYYSGYNTITQNSAGDILMDCVGDKVHFYSSNYNYTNDALTNLNHITNPSYFGSLTVED